MKECIKCKTQLEDDELFCHECGTKQEIKDAEAQNERPQELDGKKCIHCGETIENDSMFCPFCGEPQEEKEVPEEKVQNEPLNEERAKEEPVKEEPKKEESTLQDGEPEVKQEETTYEEEEEKSSKKWLWIVLALLVLGAGGWYFYNNSDWSYEKVAQTEAVDTDSIQMPEEQEEYTEEAPTSEIGFLEQFYKGEIGDEGYIQQNVTANVLNKLKRDYEYDCPSNDCLATWVFTAYPPGADLELEEGPIISEDKDGKYSVLYKYYTQGQSGRRYHPAGLLVSVTQIDGKYLISDYEVFLPNGLQSTKELSSDNDGTYYLQDGHLFLTLNKKGKEIEAEFNFRDGTYVSSTYSFSCILDDENNFQSEVHKYNGEFSGQIEGTLSEGIMKVDVEVDNKYSGEYELKKYEK